MASADQPPIITPWIEKELANQPTLNKKLFVNNNSSSKTHVSTCNGVGECWLYQENGSYYVTDMHTKLLAIVNQHQIKKLQQQKPSQPLTKSCTNIPTACMAEKKTIQLHSPKTLASGNYNHKHPVRISLRAYSYSSMMSNSMKTAPYQQSRPAQSVRQLSAGEAQKKPASTTSSQTINNRVGQNAIVFKP
jgi:hypothetical protein